MTAARFGQAAWLFPAVLAVHVAEEAQGFAGWARRHAWAGYRDGDFAVVNTVGLAGTVAATLLAVRTRRRRVFLAYHAGMVSAQAIWNTVFHAGATAAYREYSPGVVSAMALFPATWLLLTRAAIRQGRLSRPDAWRSVALGAPVHAATVAQQVYGVGRRRPDRRAPRRALARSHPHLLQGGDGRAPGIRAVPPVTTGTIRRAVNLVAGRTV